jgi:hypothetical protein
LATEDGFGHTDGYKHSKSLRVVTVGLNPSRLEFSEDDPLKRFPDMKGVEERLLNHKVYVNSLCQYFHRGNYHWFNNFEDVLNGMGASYHPGSRNIALHTDLCSPLATKKSWRDLDANTKKELKRTGLPLWERLMEYLKPQLILAPIGYKEHLQKLGKKAGKQSLFPTGLSEREMNFGCSGGDSKLTFQSSFIGNPFDQRTENRLQI